MKIATFYSFKGGVGRTMAAMNLAWALTEKRRRVVLIDADVEAPGMTMFEDFFNCIGLPQKGILDYLTAYLNSTGRTKGGKLPTIRRYAHDIKTGPENSKLFFVPVSNLKNPPDPSSIPWRKLHRPRPLRKFIDYFRQDLIDSLDPDWVIIDARTGFTELSGLFTVHVPDIVVLFTGLNDQNLQGTKWVLDDLKKNKTQAQMIAFSPMPEGEETLKKTRMAQALKLLEGQNLPRVIIPYHPLAALREQIFVRDFPDTMIAKAYIEFKNIFVPLNKDDVESVTNAGLEMLDQRKFEEALTFLDQEQYRKRFKEIEEYTGTLAEALFKYGNSFQCNNLSRELELFSRYIEIKPNESAGYINRGHVFFHLEKYKEAMADCDKAIELDPQSPAALYNLAVLLATCPDVRYRDGKRAVELAKRIYEIGGGQDPDDLAILAAAYAEAGDFKAAVKWQRKALAGLVEDGDKKKRKEMEKRLELYLHGQPYRDEG